jgi:hypothetical protein
MLFMVKMFVALQSSLLHSSLNTTQICIVSHMLFLQARARAIFPLRKSMGNLSQGSQIVFDTGSCVDLDTLLEQPQLDF